MRARGEYFLFWITALSHGERVPEGRVRGPLLAERRFGDTHIFPSCRTSMASPSSAARRTPRSAA